MASTRVRRDTRDGAARRPDRGRVIPRRRARTAPGPHKRQWCESRGKAEVDNVAVLHDVVLAFEPDLTAIAARGHRAARDKESVRPAAHAARSISVATSAPSASCASARLITMRSGLAERN